MSELPEGWAEEPYDPETDEAPSFYIDPDHDCDGTDGENGGDDTHNGIAIIRGGAGSAADRGWGPGWPKCQHHQWVTIVRSDGVRLPVNRGIKVLVALLCDETERRGYDLRPGQCWGAACRAIRGSSRPSNHSWALAVDINAPANPMTSRLVTDMPGWMPNLWNRFGFRWGGDYSGRKDAMHYEFMGTPADAKRYTELATREFGKEEDMTNEQAKQLQEVWKAVYEKRDGKLHEALDLVERKLDEILAELKTRDA